MKPHENVGKYFKAYEVVRSPTAERYNIDNTPTEQVWANAKRLAMVLDALRDYWGPTVVDSWYRSPKLNRKVGGVRNSLHMSGCAADVRPAVTGKSLRDGMEFLAGSDLKFEEAILEHGRWSSWLHVAVPRSLTVTASKELLEKRHGGRTWRWVA